MDENKSNYSFKTSLPAYQEDQPNKEFQKKMILNYMKTLGGKATLKQLEVLTGLPQSTISGRMADLRKDKEVIDSGTLENCLGRNRKLFLIVPAAQAGPVPTKQNPIFNYKKNMI